MAGFHAAFDPGVLSSVSDGVKLLFTSPPDASNVKIEIVEVDTWRVDGLVATDGTGPEDKRAEIFGDIVAGKFVFKSINTFLTIILGTPTTFMNLPVEIVGEFETWRRIRDSEGTEGWVLHSLLSGRRTAIVNAGPDKGAEKAAISLRAKADEGAADEARLQTGVIGNVKTCSSGWCRMIVTLPNRRDVDGYIRQNRLWGVYPNEVVE